jgi:hypothetical protein
MLVSGSQSSAISGQIMVEAPLTTELRPEQKDWRVGWLHAAIKLSLGLNQKQGPKAPQPIRIGFVRDRWSFNYRRQCNSPTVDHLKMFCGRLIFQTDNARDCLAGRPHLTFLNSLEFRQTA